MRILFTGASSFTGHWFVTELARAGHVVVATFRSPLDVYSSTRRRRVCELLGRCEPVFGCAFGDERFLDLLESDRFDVLCHHAAATTGYRSDDFDVLHALETNTRELREVLDRFATTGGRKVVLTGSVFEADEGLGDESVRAFSPYGLSKTLTFEVVRYRCAEAGLTLGKFVIPNPFGPLEDPRFVSYVVRSWLAGETPRVRTPDYVRDNIHVSLLARAYARFACAAGSGRRLERLNPSGYRETQGAFALRLARELGSRLGVPTPLELAEQRQFDEPRIRVNNDELDLDGLVWDEQASWDELADYYRSTVAAETAETVR